MTDEQLEDESEVLLAARGLRAAAEELALSGATIQSEIETADWAGPMRDRYATNAEAQLKELRQESDELLELAGLLDRHAEWILDEKARIDGLMNRIMAWVAVNPVGSSPTGHDAALIDAIPPRHSASWDDLADRLRASGVVF